MFDNDDGITMSLGGDSGFGSHFFSAHPMCFYIVRFLATKLELWWNDSRWWHDKHSVVVCGGLSWHKPYICPFQRSSSKSKLSDTFGHLLPWASVASM